MKSRALFEQFIGLELLRQARLHSNRIQLNFWRDLEGREVDWVLRRGNQMLPVEVKWTETPAIKHAKHLKTFLSDYNQPKGYIVCRCTRPRQLDEQIVAIPWQSLTGLIEKHFE